MLIKTQGCSVHGIDATTITVEVNITQGAKFYIVGLADNAIKESQQRIESAIRNNDFNWPGQRVVVNLAPADFGRKAQPTICLWLLEYWLHRLSSIVQDLVSMCLWASSLWMVPCKGPGECFPMALQRP
jgi:hypothetical protein